MYEDKFWKIAQGPVLAVFFFVLLLFQSIHYYSLMFTPYNDYNNFSFALSLPDAPIESKKGQEGNKVVLAEVLGDLIWEEISEAIIKDCLVYSIPTNSSKLEQYVEVCILYYVI